MHIPWYSDALGVATLRRDGLLELLETRGLLQLLDQTLNGLLAPFVLALGLLPAQQPLDDRRVKAGQHRSHHLPYDERARPASGRSDRVAVTS